MIRRRQFALLPVLAPAVLAGCGGPGTAPPAVLDLAIFAGTDQNPDASGRATSVAIKLFQLSATARFERAGVFALKDRDKETLAEDALAIEEFVLRPGENRVITRELKKGVQFIGTAVLYRDIDRAAWRAMQPVPASGPIKMSLKIARSSATLARA